MKRTVMQLEDRQYETLKRMAASEGVSMAEMLRRAIDLMQQGPGHVDREERKRRALAAAGRFRSGSRDTARRHDEYLAEAIGEHGK